MSLPFSNIISNMNFRLLSRFRATLYQCPETADERSKMTAAVSSRIDDLHSVLQTTQDHSITQLQDIAQEIDIWQQKVGDVMVM